MTRSFALGFALLVAMVAFCRCHASPQEPGASPLPWQDRPRESVPRLTVQVLAARPHDPTAFTQGLVFHQGSLYESTGLYGQSSLRRTDPETGAVQQIVYLDGGYFAEGLARVGERLIQLTWREGVALVYDLPTFEVTTQFHYDGEGWGLCFDGRRLIMSDGSHVLTFRDPDTFVATGRLPVTLDGRPAPGLNELECVGESIYANLWPTDQILRIDAESGRVAAVIDASDLLSPRERLQADVLNGIAYDPERKIFSLTGKYWPKLFEVTFVPAGKPASAPPE